MAEIYDTLQLIAYQQVVIAGGKRKKPESLVERIMKKKPEKTDDYESLSVSEFKETRKRIMRS